MPRRQMRDPDRRVRLVDVLAARARRAVGVDLQVRLVDLDLADVLGLGEHRDGAGRRVDASLRFRLRHALHAMHAGLELELRVRAFARDARDDLAVAAVLAGIRAQDLHAPALPLGVAAVHPVQIAREDRGLVPARARADLEEQIRVVVGVLRHEVHEQRLLARVALRDERPRALPRRARAAPRRCRRASLPTPRCRPRACGTRRSPRRPARGANIPSRARGNGPCPRGSRARSGAGRPLRNARPAR